MTFTEYLQEDCGGYDIRTLLENLTQEQIEESIQEYKDLNNGDIQFNSEEEEAINNIIDKGYVG